MRLIRWKRSNPAFIGVKFRKIGEYRSVTISPYILSRYHLRATATTAPLFGARVLRKRESRLGSGTPIEIVDEDQFNRAVCAGADVEGPERHRVEADRVSQRMERQVRSGRLSSRGGRAHTNRCRGNYRVRPRCIPPTVPTAPMLALELAMNRRPAGLGTRSMARLGPGAGEQPGLENRIHHALRERQVSPAASSRRIVSRTVKGAAPNPPCDLAARISADISLITSRTHGASQASSSASRSTPSQSRKSRTLLMLGDIIPEWWESPTCRWLSTRRRKASECSPWPTAPASQRESSLRGTVACPGGRYRVGHLSKAETGTRCSRR